jgi:hypothetical protein
MKAIRLIIFLPVAIIISTIFSGLYSYVMQLLVGGYKITSLFVWVSTGAITSIAIFAIGTSLAPYRSLFAKWALALLTISFAVLAIGGSWISTDYLVINSAVPAYLGHLLMYISMLLTAVLISFLSVEKVKTLSTDIIRWIVGLFIVLIAIYYSELGVFYSFEFIALKLNKIPNLLYLFAWFIYLGAIIAFLTTIFTIIFRVISLIVRQEEIFIMVLGLIMSVAFIATLILFWTNVIEFSWESLNHHRSNSIIFSLIFISLLSVPYKVASLVNENY